MWLSVVSAGTCDVSLFYLLIRGMRQLLARRVALYQHLYKNQVVFKRIAIAVMGELALALPYSCLGFEVVAIQWLSC